MVRELDIMSEQETLESAFLNWKGNPIKDSLSCWVKYVSAKTSNPREMFIYWDTRTEDIFLEILKKELANNRNYFEKLRKYFLHSYAKFGRIADVLYRKKPKAYDNLSQKELIAIFDKFNQYHRWALAGYYIVYDLVNLLPRMVRDDIELVAEELKIKNVEKQVSFFSSYGIDSLVRFERIEFLKKLIQTQKIYRKSRNWQDNAIQKLVFDHWYQLGCSSVSHGGLYFTFEDYQKRFKRHIRLDAQKAIKEIKKKEKKEEEIFEKRIETFEKYPEIITHIKWLRTMMSYRNREEEFYYIYMMHCWPFFEAIIRRIKLKDPNDFWLLSKQEIAGSIRGKINANRIADVRKKKGFTIKQVGNSIKVWTGIKKEDWHEHNVDQKISEIRGVAAFRGKVKGIAKIIFSPGSEDWKFKKGDILITSMTTPDYIALMKKASAVVTDEGGLLCHASIVARELKTICLIGTKIATKVIHDGDLVEVDANSNLLKILKRASVSEQKDKRSKKIKPEAITELRLGR